MSTLIKKIQGNIRYSEGDLLEVSFFVERDLKPTEYETATKAINTLEALLSKKKVVESEEE